MIRCFDVKCPSGHINEVFLDDKDRETDCPQEGCTEVAGRVISPVRSYLDPCSGDFPGSTMKWEKTRKQQMARERKITDNHGPDAVWDNR